MDMQNNGAAPERVDFSKIKTSIPIPNLIEVQKNSYEKFLQMGLLPPERDDADCKDRHAEQHFVQGKAVRRSCGSPNAGRSHSWSIGVWE